MAATLLMQSFGLDLLQQWHQPGPACPGAQCRTCGKMQQEIENKSIFFAMHFASYLTSPPSPFSLGSWKVSISTRSLAAQGFSANVNWRSLTFLVEQFLCDTLKASSFCFLTSDIHFEDTRHLYITHIIQTICTTHLMLQKEFL